MYYKVLTPHSLINHLFALSYLFYLLVRTIHTIPPSFMLYLLLSCTTYFLYIFFFSFVSNSFSISFSFTSDAFLIHLIQFSILEWFICVRVDTFCQFRKKKYNLSAFLFCSHTLSPNSIPSPPFVCQETEDVYTPLHLVPPTVAGLIASIENKYKINATNIRCLYR